MNSIESRCFRLSWLAVGTILLVNLLAPGGTSVEAAEKVAFPEKLVIRISSISIRDADTDLTVLSSGNLGTGFSFNDDLGGDDSVTIPRIDGYYRFKPSHRIEFGSFRIERDGRNLLTIDLDIGDESFNVGDTVISNIDYELLKIGYAYSFYHSQTVELSVTAGLHMTNYEFDYELVDGTSADSSKASGPLPMFGIRVSYAINPRWSIHYLSEVLFVDAADAEGSFQNYEVHIRYKLNENFMLGAGLTRFGIDVTTKDNDWDGRIADTHHGIAVSGHYFIN